MEESQTPANPDFNTNINSKSKENPGINYLQSQSLNNDGNSTSSTLRVTPKISTYKKYSRFNVPLLKRNESNNTSINNIDNSIQMIIPFKYSVPKYILFTLLSVLTLGIINIISFYYLGVYLTLTSIPCSIDEMNFWIIVNEDNIGNWIHIEKLASFFSTSKMRDIRNNLQQSPYSSTDWTTKDPMIIIKYKRNKYYYNSNQHMFEPVMFSLSNKTLKQIHLWYGHGIQHRYVYEYWWNKFEVNSVVIQRKSTFRVFLSFLIHPLYIYQIFSITVWWIEGYYTFATITIFAVVFILLITAQQKTKSKNELANYIWVTNKRISRVHPIDSNYLDNDPNKIDDYESSLVPGDLIYIPPNSIVPCDCLLLNGYCTTDESVLTGETSLIMKSQLPYNNSMFDYSVNWKSILFSGTKVQHAESYNNQSYPIALVIATGLNTERGNWIQNIWFEHKSNFKYYLEILQFFAFTLMLSLICIVWLCYNYYTNDAIYQAVLSGDLFNIVLLCWDVFTLIFPPTIPICLTFGAFNFQHYLMTKNIACEGEYRLNAAGRINVVWFDKTGTLTKEGLDWFGFQTTRLNDRREVTFDSIEKRSKVYNHIHMKFYQSLFQEQNQIDKDYRTDPKNNLIYFTECLASCHSVDQFRNKYFGNNLDYSIFKNIEWDWMNNYEEIAHKNKIKRKNIFYDDTDDCDKEEFKAFFYEVMPRNNLYVTGEQCSNESGNRHKSFKLRIIKRFEFLSKFQSCSVWVKNWFDNSWRFYIKGAPEKIVSSCVPGTWPSDYHEQLQKLTSSGFRVIACATKYIDDDVTDADADDSTEAKLVGYPREYFENNLTFLGFVIFENKLKADTKSVLTMLKKSGWQIVINTGDNAFTSLSVAQETNLAYSKDIVGIFEAETIDSGKDTERKKILFYKTNIEHSSWEKYILNFEVYSKPVGEQEELNEINNNWDKLSLRSNQHLESNIQIQGKENILTWSELINMIKKETQMSLCLSGDSFIFLLGKCKEKESKTLQSSKWYYKWFKLFRKKAIIFYRMTPRAKIELVNFFKENPNNIVAMCGDGANDSGAWLAADVGIAIQGKYKGIIFSHFISMKDSIKSVELIINNGRTCFENSEILLKYLTTYSVLELLIKILLFYDASDMTNNQYFFMDCGIAWALSILLSRTESNNLNKYSAKRKLLNCQFFTSIIGHIILQIVSFIVFNILIGSILSNEKVIFIKDSDNLNYKNSYWFLWGAFQCINYGIMFNWMSVYKKKIYSNKTFILYWSAIVFYLVVLISLDYFRNSKSTLVVLIGSRYDSMNSQWSRWYLFGFSFGNGLLAYLWETLVIKNIK